MEEVRKINKRGQVVCSIEFNGRVYKRYPNGKHPNYYYWKFGHGNKQSEIFASCRLQILSWGNSEWKDYPPH